MSFFYVTSTISVRCFLIILAASSLVSAQLSGVGTKTEKTCAGIKIDDTVSGCTGAMWSYSKAKPRITAKTVVPVKILQGRGAGIASKCDMLVPATFIMEVFMDNTVCDEMLQVSTTVLRKMETALKKQLTATSNKQSLQRQRISQIKEAIFTRDMLKTRRYGELDRLATFDYLVRQKSAAMATAKQIDATVKSSVKVSGGVEAELSQLYTKIQSEQAILQAQVMQKVKRLQQQAKQTQNNAANCGKAGAGGAKGPRSVGQRLVRSFNLISGMPTSLEVRAALAARAPTVPRTPRDGPRAPPAPSCPMKNPPPKKAVPRSKVQEKQAPAKRPRQPRSPAKPKPRSPNKKVAKRPATRPRRQPGKVAQPKRTTPKRKPKTVPKPTRRPKGSARPRRRGRK